MWIHVNARHAQNNACHTMLWMKLYMNSVLKWVSLCRLDVFLMALLLCFSELLCIYLTSFIHSQHTCNHPFWHLMHNYQHTFNLTLINHLLLFFILFYCNIFMSLCITICIIPVIVTLEIRWRTITFLCNSCFVILKHFLI